MKASFFERLGAYLIDLIIITIIASIIGSIIPSKQTNITSDIGNLTNQYVNGEITTDNYLEEYKNILYTSEKENTSESVIGLLITIAYFVVFQYLNKGQTIGKLALNIKVVNASDNEVPNIFSFLLRNLIPFGIFTSTLNLIAINTLNKASYFNVYYTASALESLFILGVVISIIVNNDNRGLHDMLAKTKVIKEERRQ